MNIKTNFIKQTWTQLAIIQIAGVICLPILMIGEQIGRSYEFFYAITSIIIGNLLLCILAIITSFMAFSFKQYTIKNAQIFFGFFGTKLLGISMIISLIGWFAIQLSVISLSIEKIMLLIFNVAPYVAIINVVVGLVLIITARFGIYLIKKVSTFFIPFFIIVMFISLVKSIQNPIVQVASNNKSYCAISLVIASAIMAVIDLPTYYRFSRSKKDSFISLVILFIIVVPILEIIGMFIGLHGSGSNILESLTNNQNKVFQFFILMFLILSGCTTNNMNLYSATTTLNYFFNKFSLTTRTIFLGFMGIVLSCFNILENFEPMLNSFGILLSGMGSVMITNFLINDIRLNTNKIYFIKNIVAWIIGCIVGFLTFFKYITLLSCDIVNAYIAASFATLILQKLFKD